MQSGNQQGAAAGYNGEAPYPACMVRSIVIPTALALLLLTAPGCAAPLVASAAPAAARAGTSAFVSGEMRIARKASMAETWQAAHDALATLELDIKITRCSDRRRYIMARDGDRGPEIRIQLDRRSPVLTKISIRVGFFGDAAVSRVIVQQIDAQLAAESTAT